MGAARHSGVGNDEVDRRTGSSAPRAGRHPFPDEAAAQAA